jgi:hypothetical protein
MTTRPPLPGSLLTRRDFVAGATAAAAALLTPLRSLAEPAATSGLPEAARSAAQKSPLVYISPLRSDGSESRCHGEVWFAMDGDDLLVVTEPSRWRAAAIGEGLDRARIWVGDYGVWKRAEDRFRKAPSFVAVASIESDREVHARALAVFGGKYPDEWSKWGPRFEQGLASGKRVMIRYRPH